LLTVPEQGVVSIHVPVRHPDGSPGLWTKEAIELHISCLREDGEEIPADNEFIISRIRIGTVAVKKRSCFFYSRVTDR
jgi:hypothetical protein